MTLPQKRLLAACVAALLVWNLPFVEVLALPLVWLNTHLHELSHAVAALATGGEVERIRVFASGGGDASIRGGWIVVVASAGYLGAAAVGGALLAWAKTEERARQSLWGLAVVLAVSLLIWVRADWVGVLSGAGWAIGLWALSRKLNGPQLVWTAQFLGAIQCLASVDAFRALFWASRTGSHSDAALMQQATGVPGLFWASVWFLASLCVLFAALRSAWKSTHSEPTTQVL